MQVEAFTREIEVMTPKELEEFFQKIDQLPDAHSKLEYSLQYMEKAISQAKTPDFKMFWEVRKKCIELFKEHLPAASRSLLWNRFSELSKEARRVKEYFDSQSDFAAEQIDIAIKAIEEQIEQLNQGTLPEEGESKHLPKSLSKRSHWYNEQQRQLNHLNIFASRITALRKELIKTEIRIRTKNQFFDRLSKAGDAVFPLRKTMINDVSKSFQEDVDEFVRNNFSGEEMKLPFYVLREEIKELQNSAKYLSLNTQVFSDTRLKLSAAWDQVKEKDKERKQELEKKKDIFKQNFDELNGQLTEIDQKFSSETATLNDTLDAIEKFAATMRAKELGRDEVHGLRKVMGELRDKVRAKQTLAEQEKQKQEEIRNEQKRAMITAFDTKITQFMKEAQDLELEEIQVKKAELLDELHQASFNKSQKVEFEKKFKPLNELVKAKKEKALLNLPADERQALEQLKELYNQKIDERDELKLQIEQSRRLRGSSGFNIQKALELNQTQASQKEQLDKIIHDLSELEEKIDQLESK